jgi:hypothetical protein
MIRGVRIGREEILEFMGQQFKVYSWQTVRRWRDKGMPMRRQWNRTDGYGRPIILESEVIKWQLKNKTLPKC